MRRGLLLLLVAPVLVAAGADSWRPLPGSAAFESVLAYEDRPAGVAIAPYDLLATPVTNRQFLDFVRSHWQWQRGQVPAVFAESRYLQRWAGATELGPLALPAQPVTHVSWFGADAYCRSLGARLPSWDEWEHASAADRTRADARADPAWRERILAWYARPSNAPLPAVGAGEPDVHGVHDLHGLVWEWVDDHAALLVASDNRTQGDADRLAFCGAGALSTDDRENYAVLMRIAMLSALQAADVTGNLGFRCARPPGDRP